MNDVTQLYACRSERSTFEVEQGEEVLHAFLFRSAEGLHYALSSDAKGQSLPRDFSGASAWIFQRPIDLVSGENRVEFDSDEVIRSLSRDGFALIGYIVGH